MFGWAARAAAGTITGAALTQSRAKADAASERLQNCYEMRVKAAGEARDAGLSKLTVNGDETRYRDRSGNFSKGLPHNSRGDVESSAYNALASALLTGNSRDFETVAMGGTAKLVNPQAGLAFDMEGRDSH